MFKRNAKFVSAVFASFLAAAALTAMSCSPARAAEECLSGPKAHTPQGGHWYYYIDPPTKRHCWYLGEEGAKVLRTAAPNSSRGAPPDLQKTEAAMQPAVANARAELPAQLTIEQPNNGNTPAPAVTANAAIWENGAPGLQTQRSIVASRWPGQSDEDPPADPAPDRSNSSAGALATARSQPAPPAAGQLAAADLPSEASTYSMPMQLAALMGALAIAGIIGSVVFKFGGTQRAVQVQADARRTIWENANTDSRTRSGYPRADARARRPDFSSAANDVGDQDGRVAEFFAQLSRRPPV
jgi:hypothetical protein